MPNTTPTVERQEARMEAIVIAVDARRKLRSFALELDRELATLIEQNRRANQAETNNAA